MISNGATTKACLVYIILVIKTVVIIASDAYLSFFGYIDDKDYYYYYDSYHFVPQSVETGWRHNISYRYICYSFVTKFVNMMF